MVLETKTSALESTSTAEQAKVTALETTSSTELNKVIALETKVGTLERTSSVEAVTTLERQVSTLEDQVLILTTMLAVNLHELQRNNTVLENELESLRNHITKEITTLNSTSLALSDDIDAVTKMSGPKGERGKSGTNGSDGIDGKDGNGNGKDGEDGNGVKNATQDGQAAAGTTSPDDDSVLVVQWLVVAYFVGVLVMLLLLLHLLFLCCRRRRKQPPQLSVVAPQLQPQKQQATKLNKLLNNHEQKLKTQGYSERADRVQNKSAQHSQAKKQKIQQEQVGASKRLQQRLQKRRTKSKKVIGWVTKQDPTTGRDYYFHEGTGESTWERPAEMNSSSPVGGTVTNRVRRRSKIVQSSGPPLIKQKETTEDFRAEEREMIEKTRSIMKNKIGTLQRLNAAFVKLDLDSNGVLSKREFGHLVSMILKTGIDKKKLDLLWRAVWDLDKDGVLSKGELRASEEELNAPILGTWLCLLEGDDIFEAAAKKEANAKKAADEEAKEKNQRAAAREAAKKRAAARRRQAKLEETKSGDKEQGEGEEAGLSSSSLLPVESARLIVKKKIGSEEKLKMIFGKLTSDSSVGMTKEEFYKFVKVIHKQALEAAPAEDVLDQLWKSAKGLGGATVAFDTLQDWLFEMKSKKVATVHVGRIYVLS